MKIVRVLEHMLGGLERSFGDWEHFLEESERMLEAGEQIAGVLERQRVRESRAQVASILLSSCAHDAVRRP